MQVERGEGDALTHLDGCLDCCMVVLVEFEGLQEREGKAARKWAAADVLIRQQAVQPAQEGAVRPQADFQADAGL